MNRLIPLVALGAALASCGREDSGSDKKEFTLPDVSIECGSPATGCVEETADSKAVSIVWSSVACDALSDPEQVKAGGASTVTCLSSKCTATVTNWVTPPDAPITSLPEGTYSLCAEIDLDRDGVREAGDPLGALVAVAFAKGAEAQTITAFEDAP